MEYFAAATRQQQYDTYKRLPAGLLSLSAGSATSASSPSNSAPSVSPAPATSSIPSFLSELLPSAALSASYPSKLHNKFLQLAAAEPTATTVVSAAAQSAGRRGQRGQQSKKGQRHRGVAAAGRPLTAQQRKQLRLFSLPLPDSSAPLLYANFLPLHRLWQSYMHDLLQQPHSALPLSAGERLLKADYHGARATVVRSTAPSCVHVSGIVIQESASGWRLIGEDNAVRVVRKEGSVLRVNIDTAEVEQQQQQQQQQQQGGGWQVELYGDQLAVRSAERAAKRWKGKSSIQLLS